MAKLGEILRISLTRTAVAAAAIGRCATERWYNVDPSMRITVEIEDVSQVADGDGIGIDDQEVALSVLADAGLDEAAACLDRIKNAGG